MIILVSVRGSVDGEKATEAVARLESNGYEIEYMNSVISELPAILQSCDKIPVAGTTYHVVSENIGDGYDFFKVFTDESVSVGTRKVLAKFLGFNEVRWSSSTGEELFLNVVPKVSAKEIIGKSTARKVGRDFKLDLGYKALMNKLVKLLDSRDSINIQEVFDMACRDRFDGISDYEIHVLAANYYSNFQKNLAYFLKKSAKLYLDTDYNVKLLEPGSPSFDLHKSGRGTVTEEEILLDL